MDTVRTVTDTLQDLTREPLNSHQRDRTWGGGGGGGGGEGVCEDETTSTNVRLNNETHGASPSCWRINTLVCYFYGTRN